MEEIWKDIDGFENYQISNHGRIKSKERIVENACRKYLKKEEFLKINIMKQGYKFIVLRDFEQKRHLLKIHRLVALAFIPNPNNYEQVNHIDGNKLNNNVDNLEWCTPKQNTRHAIVTGLRQKYSGRNIQRIYQFCSTTKELKKVHENFSEAAKSIGESTKNSLYSASKSHRDYKGYFWITEDDYKSGGLEKCNGKRRKHSIPFCGEYLTAKEYSSKSGLPLSRVRNMLETGEIKDCYE